MDYISPDVSRRPSTRPARAARPDVMLQRLHAVAQTWNTVWNEALADENQPAPGFSSLGLTRFHQATRPATGRVGF